MIVNKELVVSNRKKADIIDELRQKKFRPFPKVAKAKAAGETEDVEENDEAEEAASGTSTDYDYLLGMAIWSLTKEKIEKLLQQAADKEKELLALLELTPTQIWNTDLDRFIEEWEVSGTTPFASSLRAIHVGWDNLPPSNGDRKRVKSGTTRAWSTRAVRRSSGNRRRSKRESRSALANALVTRMPTTTLCRPRRPPPPKRASPSPLPPAHRARDPKPPRPARTTKWASTTTTRMVMCQWHVRKRSAPLLLLLLPLPPHRQLNLNLNLRRAWLRPTRIST